MINYYASALKKYADFSGRARRCEYWYFFLGNLIISIILLILGNGMRTDILANIFSLATFVPSLAVGVRRMHDVGKSGWFILIPIYNLILACTDGQVGPNEYGPDPKRPELEDDIEKIGTDLHH